MKEFNKALHEDIALLRMLHVKKDKREFNALKSEIMHKHNISKATVYREMKKETPGSYKTPNYNPPIMDISRQEILMVRELLLSGRQNSEIIKIMGRELGIHYYWDRFNRARELSEELSKEEYDPKKTNFAVNGNMFLTKLLGFEYVSPGCYHEIKINGHTLKATYELYEMVKLQIMKDNPADGEKGGTRLIINDVQAHFALKDITMRNINAMQKGEGSSSSYAVRCAIESLEKLERKERLMAAAKKHLLEKNPWGTENKSDSGVTDTKSKKMSLNIPAIELKDETLPEGKKLTSQTVRQRTRNGNLTGVTVVKKFY